MESDCWIWFFECQSKKWAEVNARSRANVKTYYMYMCTHICINIFPKGILINHSLYLQNNIWIHCITEQTKNESPDPQGFDFMI